MRHQSLDTSPAGSTRHGRASATNPPSTCTYGAAQSDSAAAWLPSVRDRTRRDAWATVVVRWLLSGIVKQGTLTLRTPDGPSLSFGDGAPAVSIRITDWKVMSRLALDPDLAVGEAYMDGTLIVDDGRLYEFLELCLANLGRNHGNLMRRFHVLCRWFGRRFAQWNTVAASRANVAHHYDLSDTLYDLFLDADRQYSCGYFLSPDDTLETAQERKKRHLAAKLLLRPGQRVLDIGSGWGGLARHLANSADIDVTGITLSAEQLEYANRQAREAGVANRVRFLLEDYRRLSGRYDRIVSVGMFEHVGVGLFHDYFRKIGDLLTDDGIALVHTIGSADGPGAPHPWIRKYIFPGGYVPALSEIVPIIERCGLYITDIEVLRVHYAETLRAWRQRFMANRGCVASLYDERFCRMWEFYLAGCEAAFRKSGLVVFQVQLSKRIDAVPLVRDYIAKWEAGRDGGPAATFAGTGDGAGALSRTSRS